MDNFNELGQYDCVQVRNNPMLWFYDTLEQLMFEGALTVVEFQKCTKDLMLEN